MLRDRAWRGLQQSTLEYVESAFGDQALIVPRAWYLSQVQTEWAYIEFADPASGAGGVANGLVGLHPDEARVTGIDAHLTAGRFFAEGDDRACILPSRLAELAGVAPDEAGSARVRLFGEDYTVIGILDAAGVNALVDLDGESLTPVDTVNEADKVNRYNKTLSGFAEEEHKAKEKAFAQQEMMKMANERK